MASQQFCLKWNNHQSNMVTVFDDLLINEDYVDVTLACEGFNIKAHKMVLSACSPFFQEVFKNNPCQHPIVIMKDMKYGDLKAIVRFMYKGEVNVSQDQLSALLKTAESLQIKGLAEVANENANEQSSESHVSSRQPEIVDVPSNYLPHRSTTPPTKRRKRKPSTESAPVPVESTSHTASSSDNISSHQINTGTTQYQQSSTIPSSQSSIQCIPTEPQSAPPTSSAMYPELKLKCESPDEPEVIPIQLDQEINRVKSPPIESSHHSNEASCDASSYPVMNQNIDDMNSSQSYFDASNSFVSQLQDNSEQRSQHNDSIVSQGGEIVQYGDEVGGDLALSYMEAGPNSSMTDELSPGPSSLSHDNAPDARNSGNDKSSVCPDCGHTFATKHTMFRHWKHVHNRPEVRFKCRICSKDFTYRHNLKRHIIEIHSVGSYSKENQ